MSDSRDADEALFEIQEHILELRRSGQPVDVQELAERFSVTVDDVEVCLRAAEVLGDAVDTTPVPPDLPAEFELLGELGRGGMGVVYRVHQKPLGRDLALKVLRTTQLDDAESMQRFEHEARALARLRHPNIVGVHSVGRSGTAIYYTMDLVEGRDLSEVLRDKPLPIEQAVHLARQVADAVAHAHRQNILHRDLKPGNVLMDPDGNAHVVDFGLARDLSSDRSRQTATGQLLGTPGSMSPEQARGDGDAVSAATDVHGLGALLFEMLIGKPPFAADSLHELLRAVVENDPPRADSLRRSVPRDLATICEHAMARDPAARYPSAEAFADDLRRFAENEPVAAQPVGLALRAGRRLMRERRLAIVTLTALVLIGAAFFVGSRFEREGHSLTLASSLRARGEVVAALALLEEAEAELGGARQQQQWVRALLDCAELASSREQADDWLARAGSIIAANFRITRIGGRSVSRGEVAAAHAQLAPYRDEEFEDRNAENGESPPWSVLALRHAFLMGDLERVAIAFDQFELLGPDLGNVLDWSSPARANRADPAHASALGVCMLLELEDADRFDRALEDRDAPRQLWQDLVRVRAGLPTAVADKLDRTLGSVEVHWTTSMSPGELSAIALAQVANEPTATGMQRANACALIAAAMGCPPAFGAGYQPVVFERTLTVWETWRRADARTRFQLRNDHAAWLWQRLPEDFAEEQALAEWFAVATGCPDVSRKAALSWWHDHRTDDPMQLLARSDTDRDVDALLDGLGSLSGSDVLRVHDLLCLHARAESVPWPGGGPAARGSVGDPRRIGWMHAWLRAFDRAAPREVRLRLAVLAFDDGATLPRVAARSSVTGRVGHSQTVQVAWRDLLVDPSTRTVRHSRLLDCNLLGAEDSGVRFEQETKVTLLPGAGGAVALIEDDSWITCRNSEWSVNSRDGGIPARFAVGEVGALATLSANWQRRADRTVELVLMAALEDGEAPATPWSAQTWTVGVERALLATPDEEPPSRCALRAAANLPMRAARAVLARSAQAEPDSEDDYDFEEERWLARLHAGEAGLEPVPSAIRGLGERWHGAAVWGRLLRISEPGPIRDQARQLLHACRPGRAVARTLVATLPREELEGDLQAKIDEALEPGWTNRLRWLAFAVMQAGWLLSITMFLRSEPRSLKRERLRANVVFLMALAFQQSAVVASLAWPMPWLWFAINAWLFHLGWSERERASRVARLTGQTLIAMALLFFAGAAGWWNVQSDWVRLLPAVLILLAGIGGMRAAVALQGKSERARRRASKTASP